MILISLSVLLTISQLREGIRSITLNCSASPQNVSAPVCVRVHVRANVCAGIEKERKMK